MCRGKRLDLLRVRCEVVESATEVGSALVWGPTKTDERRTARLPRLLAEPLGEHLADRPRDPDALVFTAPLGGPLRERKFLHGQRKPAARRVGLPTTLRAHDLRHTAASLLIRQGASVKAVQRTLGHKSAVMTLDRYGHLWPDELEDLAERLDRARAAAVAPPCALSAARPSSRYAKEQVSDLLRWWRWGDSNSASPVSARRGQGAVGGSSCGFSDRLRTTVVRCCPRFALRPRTQRGPRDLGHVAADDHTLPTN
jgi:hypothetical protein